MAAQTEMVFTGLPDSWNEDFSGMQGALHVGRPDKSTGGQGTEPIYRPTDGAPARQQTESCIKYDVFDVVPPTPDPFCDGKDTGRVAAGQYNIGDIRSGEWGSGARANFSKTRFDLVPLHLLTSCADVFEFGANKYAEWNWAKGMQWSVPYACIMRHMAAWSRGEDFDKESGKPHLGHVMANLLMLEHYATAYKAGDNRPKEWFSNE